jgi:hypothetical protein
LLQLDVAASWRVTHPGRRPLPMFAAAAAAAAAAGAPEEGPQRVEGAPRRGGTVPSAAA